MKTITRLEKSRAFWYLLCILVLFFFLRLPSLIEPNWYGDEGIYQVIGRAIHSGRFLYSQIWDNKPPLLYLVYALFNGDQFSIRFASLTVGLLSVSTFFYLSKDFFKKISASFIATILFTLLFATPFLEGNIANAENFMLLPIMAAAFLIVSITTKHKINHRSSFFHSKTRTLFLAGLLVGIAFLFKIIALFDFAAFFVYLFIVSFQEKNILFSKLFSQLTVFVKEMLPIIVGFLLPVVFTVLYFFLNNALPDFIRAAFFGNIGYVGYANKFIIPQGLLITKLLVLVLFLFFLFQKRKTFSQPTIFILVWTAFSLFNTFFSQRPYLHYVLVLLPSFCLLVGLLFVSHPKKEKAVLIASLFAVLFFLGTTFKAYGVSHTFAYYKNAMLFVSNKKDIISYQTFFDGKTPRDYEVASFIKMHTTTADNVFIWGNSAQIYVLSDKLPLGKYTVAYHITQDKQGIIQTQTVLNKTKPKYVIALTGAPSLPFALSIYTTKFAFKNATIYERNL